MDDSGSSSSPAVPGGRRFPVAVVAGVIVLLATAVGAGWIVPGLFGDDAAGPGLLPLSDDATADAYADPVPQLSPTTTPPSGVAAPTSTVLTVPPGGALVATARSNGTDEVPVWAVPGGDQPAWRLSALTEFGSPRHFLVLEEQSEWLKVSVPVRPNGTVGWIPRRDAALSVSAFRVRIALSQRTFQVWRDDELIIDTISAVGNDRAPTPLGEFYIRDVFAWNPESVYGPWVLALSAFSEHIDEINGGEAVVAIHGTNRPDLLGQAVSLGCIRLHNDDVTRLAETVPVGTPVEIVA